MTEKYLVNMPVISLEDKNYYEGDIITIRDEYYAQFKDAFDKHIEFNHIIPIKGSALEKAEKEIIKNAQETIISDEQIETDAQNYVDGLSTIGNQ